MDMFTSYGHIIQGRIQDLKKEGVQWLRRLAPKTFLANLGDFVQNVGQKGVSVRPPPPPLCVIFRARPIEAYNVGPTSSTLVQHCINVIGLGLTNVLRFTGFSYIGAYLPNNTFFGRLTLNKSNKPIQFQELKG